jgi:phosphorylated CTD-interacting factor 1
LRKPELALETNVLREQLEEALPTSAYISWNQRHQIDSVLRVVQNWIRAAKEWLSKKNAEKPSTHYEQAREAIFKFENDSFAQKSADEIIAHFNQLRKDCMPFFKEQCREVIDDVLRKLVDESHKVNTQMENFLSQTRKEKQTDHVSVLVRCRNKHYEVEYKKNVLHITALHYNKLRTLWNVHADSHDDRTPQFDVALWVLLRRYATLFGLNEDHMEGASFHAAAPETFFNVLKTHLGVAHECFASPFNCYFRSFCSAFPDTDRPFGSKGSFFYFQPRTGSFEVGPPYTVEVMENTAKWVETLLQSSKLPLSFVVCVPDWRTPLQPAQQRMESSSFLRDHFVAEGKKHAYVVGHQHLPGGERHPTRGHHSTGSYDRMFVLPFKTHVYILQNEAGAAKWPLTPKILAEMQNALERAANFTKKPPTHELSK